MSKDEELNRLKEQNESLQAEIERLKSSSEGVKEYFKDAKPLDGKALDILDETFRKSLKSQTKRDFGAVEEKKEEPCCEFCGLQSCRDKTCKL